MGHRRGSKAKTKQKKAPSPQGEKHYPSPELNELRRAKPLSRARLSSGRRRATRLLLVLLSGGLVALVFFIPQYRWRHVDTTLRAKELHEQIRSILFGPGQPYRGDPDPVTVERRGQLGTAKSLIDEALLLDAGGSIQSDLHNDLGQLYYEQRRFSEAEMEFRKAIEIEASWSEPHNNLGNVLDVTGRLEEAIAEYRLAIKLGPGRSDGYVGLCITLIEKRQLNEAARSAETAMGIDSLNPEASDCQGVALDYLGDHAGAEHAFRRAIEIRPSFAGAHRSLAIVLMNKPGRPIGEALAEIRKATTLRSDNPKNWSLLAAILSTTPLSIEAYAAARRALELDANEPTANRILQSIGSPAFLASQAAPQYEIEKESLLIRALTVAPPG